jgi:hypothetical protein
MSQLTTTTSERPHPGPLPQERGRKLGTNSKEGARKRVPWFARRQVSCPECGQIYTVATLAACTTQDKSRKPVSITCERCGMHDDWDEFWTLNDEKYLQTAEV